jgi:hypothetical protein
MQSICDQLLYEKSLGMRDLRNVKFVWIERDPILVNEVEIVKKMQQELEKTDPVMCPDDMSIPEGHSIMSSNLSSRLLALIPPGITTDIALDELYRDGNLASDCLEAQLGIPDCIERPPLDWDDETVLADDLSDSSSSFEYRPKKQVFDLQVYLTGDFVLPESTPYTRHGRPDIKSLFDEMRKDAMDSGEKKVAVCVSAPKTLMTLCRKACILYSDYRVRFDFHSEAMSI